MGFIVEGGNENRGKGIDEHPDGLGDQPVSYTHLMQFTLADETETLDIAADIVKSRNLGIKPRQFLQKVSRIKTNSDVFSDLSDDRSEEKAPSDHTPFTALGLSLIHI